MTYCILNGQIVPENEAVVSVQDRGFRYGDGVFETIAVQGGVACQLEWHLERLRDGLQAIKIPFATNLLAGLSYDLLRKNAVDNAILRIQVTRGCGSKGYLPDSSSGTGATFVIETLPMPPVPRDGLVLWQSSYRKFSPRALPVEYKLCQGLNSTLARMEAAENKCFDALLLNEQEHLCETSSGNIFWVKDHIIYTPTLECGVLRGSTRDAIMRLSPYPLREMAATLDMLLQADEVWICNVLWQALPVTGLQPVGKEWSIGPIIKEIQQLLLNDREEYRRNARQ